MENSKQIHRYFSSMKLSLLRTYAFCFVLLFLFVTPLHADHDPPKALAGPPFTDPSLIMEMPEEWEKQPIKYDQSVGKADLAITLDQHLYPALFDSIKKYAKEHSLKIVVSEGTCGISAGRLSRKQVDVGGYCCAPGKSDRLPGLRFHTLAIGALALLVHPDNPIDNVTLKEAQQIYQGKIFRWSELKTADGRPGPDKPIQAVARLHCKLRPGHWRSLLDAEDLFSSRLREVGTIQDEMLQVSSNQWAVGAAETLYMEERYRFKRKLKPLKINGYSPTEPEHLISGNYPLYFTYSVTTWEEENTKNPLAQKLVDYIFQQIESVDSKFHMIPASSLRKAGWKFKDTELIGEPD